MIDHIETNLFDIEEIHDNCTVQVLTNSVTGEVSVGWRENPVAGWVGTQPYLDDSNYKKDGMSYYCSNCKHRAGKHKHRTYLFCPWCGAKIVKRGGAGCD